MFIHQELADDKNLTNRHKIILARILAEISINGYCDITTEELASEVLSDKRFVRKKISDLEKRGYIKIEQIKVPKKIKRIITITPKYRHWILDK